MTLDRARICRYLLGQLSPGEREEVERHYFADPGAFEAMLAQERQMRASQVRRRLWTAVAAVAVVGLGLALREVPAPPAPVAGRPTPPQAGGIVTATLVPGRVRSGEPNSPVELPPGSRVLRLRLFVAGGTPGAPCQVSLETVEGREVWRSEWGTLSGTPDGAQCEADVPAGVLDRRDFVVMLWGAAGRVGAYALEIAPRRAG